jgi:hypothetical protein
MYIWKRHFTTLTRQEVTRIEYSREREVSGQEEEEEEMDFQENVS